MVDSIKNAFSAELSSLEKLDNKEQAGKPRAGESFNKVLSDSINKVNDLQTEADKAIESLAKGETKNIHETMIAVEKANLSFNMMLQVRNKLLTAYEEMMRMQV